MPFIDVNGAKYYYEVFGVDRVNKAPIVLIHGSTITGHADWQHVAPLLARDYRVIVPDCRGHGLSNNPKQSYSFAEMADDISTLVRSLNYKKAHIIGHSNGGNIALVTLVQHPEVVQTAILQAANAWVSPDLIEKEPHLFDPERVERERPEWKNEMIELHSMLHGPDYWRTLLKLTVDETIREPNYTPEILADVTRPTFVIQGENNGVNAPYKHAQFIARHIPEAELWIPAGIGHNVHFEQLFEWVERVSDFLSRRGSDINDALYRLRRRKYPDDRLTVFSVRSIPSESQAEHIILEGKVLYADQKTAALDVVSGKVVNDQIKVLLHTDTPWALIKRGVTDLRKEPRNVSELVSQVLFGESVRILEDSVEWCKVRIEQDGYLGWVQKNALYLCSQSELEMYHAKHNMLVVADKLDATLQPSPDTEYMKLPFGVSVNAVQAIEGFARILLPDGGSLWVDRAGLIPIAEKPKPDQAGIAYTLSLFRKLVGIPYIWGGRSSFGTDCSGFCQTFYRFLGIQIPRDADQQYYASLPVESPPHPGDLLFFGGEVNDNLLPFQQRVVTHVAVSLGGDEMVHANGTTWSVAYNSLNPESPLYRAWLREHLVKVGRFI